MKMKLMSAITTLLLLGGSAGVAATFTYNANGGFVDGGDSPTGTNSAFLGNTDFTDPVTINSEILYHGIDWGVGSPTPSEQSGLRLIPPPANGTVTSQPASPNPTQELFGELDHINEPISTSGGSLIYAKIRWNLTVVDDANASNNFEQTWDFDLYNWETSNGANPCPNQLTPPIYQFPNNVDINGTTSYTFTRNAVNGSNCDDAHSFAVSQTKSAIWESGGIVYRINGSGFYNADGNLTHTFWSPENGTSRGSVKFYIEEIGSATATIGDRVWVDLNHDGIQNDPNHAVAVIPVELHGYRGTTPAPDLDQNTTTNTNGFYEFSNVTTNAADPTINYKIKFVFPPAVVGKFEFSPKDQGGDDALDSDVNPTTGETDTFIVDSNRTDIDAGIMLGAIGDYVWVDKDNDGIQDSDEIGLADITVNLYKDSTHVDTRTTGLNGEYLFEPLGEGTYHLEFVLPNGYKFSPQDQGGDDTKDSDANTTTGETADIAIAFISGIPAHFEDWDAGMFQELNISKEANVTVATTGDLVKYTITVTNYSERNATDVNVTDFLPNEVAYDSHHASQGDFANDIWEVGLLAANGGSAELNITVEVISTSSGSVDNNACVVTEQNIIPICDDVSFTVITPAITVEKSTNGQGADIAPGPVVLTGSTVTWEYNITNTGDANLSSIALNDNPEGAITSCPETTLAVGESMICTHTGTATTGQYENNATVTGMTPTGAPVSDSDLSHYYAEAPSIDVEKYTNGENADVAPGPEVAIGSTVNWTYVITNTGDVNLSNITLIDDPVQTITCPKDWLAAGENMTCDANSTAIDGQYENNATVTGTTATRTQALVSDSDLSHYYGGVCPCNDVPNDSLGGGCTYNPNSKSFDMMYVLMLLSILFFGRKELKRNER